MEEKDRLLELESYDILDSITERDYEDITRLASIICDVPIALISFVDKNRQWFKSHLGLHANETPREQSFCAHAIKNVNSAFIIEDSRLDSRVKDNPLVTGNPNIVFYAGMPLVSEAGHGLGTVCVIDTKPRMLSAEQLDALKILSAQVMKLLELRKRNLLLDADAKKLREFISTQVTVRTQEIKDQNDALETLNKELQAFTYISSHDLQEPLRKIQMFTSIILKNETEGITEKCRDYLERIRNSSNKMQVLVKDLLAYTKATLSERIYEKTDLNAIIDEIKSELEEEIREKNAVIIPKNEIELVVIPFQFRQLLYNLISNAIKFSRPGIVPEITVDAVFETGNSISRGEIDPARNYFHIRVADNGIGFDNKYADKIFEIFQRLDAAKTDHGTGIGLAIVKKIIENHDGYIFASGVRDAGAVFDIYLPAGNGNTLPIKKAV